MKTIAGWTSWVISIHEMLSDHDTIYCQPEYSHSELANRELFSA